MPTLAALALLLLTTFLPAPAPGWRVAASLPGVFDVAGPRPDGQLVVAGSQGLWLLDPSSGTTRRFAPVYGATGGSEAYIAVAPSDTGCFPAGDVYALSARVKGGVTRIAANGDVHPLTVVQKVDGLGGIVFDNVGRFQHRLLVFGGHGGKTTVAAIDCTGKVSVITTQAHVAEGGPAVAPAGFGAFGGSLVLTDELSGSVFAVTASGSILSIATPKLAHGGDIGVEGAGFVPPGDVASDEALFADRATPGSPHPGSDYLLAAPGDLLVNSGVRAGDLLVATEGGAGLDAIRCASTNCEVIAVIPPNAGSHGEGHVLVLTRQTSSRAPSVLFGAAPIPPRTPFPGLQVALLALIAIAIGLLAVRIRARRGSRSGPP